MTRLSPFNPGLRTTDPATWRADAVVCCSWQQVAEADPEESDGGGDGGSCWPSGAQPLARLLLTADAWLLAAGSEEGEEEDDEWLDGLWRVEAEAGAAAGSSSRDGDSAVVTVTGPDLASLCAALQQLQRRHHHLRPGPTTRRALRRGLADVVHGLREELDLLCALVEGTAPDAALVRRVVLAQPAQAAAVYLLGLLVSAAGPGSRGRGGGGLIGGRGVIE